MQETTLSRIQDIYKHLKSKGFDVYFPVQKVGECTKPYIVVKDMATSKINGISSTMSYYDVMCYVPGNMFGKLAPYVDSVKEAMKEMMPMIICTHTETPSFYDDTIKAHMISVQYRNVRYAPNRKV